MTVIERHPIAMTLLALSAVGTVSCAGPVRHCLQTPVGAHAPVGALEVCRAAVAKKPSSWEVFQRYAQLLLLRARYQELVDRCRKMLAKDPQRDDVRYMLAVGLRKLKRYGAAVEQYRRYARRHPSEADPWYGIALCSEAEGRKQDAIAAYERYLQLERREERAGWTLRAEAALVLLRRAEQQPKGSAEAPHDAKESSLASDKAEPQHLVAAKDCRREEQAVRADPFAIDAYDRLVQCTEARGLHRKTLRWMRTALRDNPEYARAWWYMARAYEALGEHELAKGLQLKACAAKVQQACPEQRAEP